MGLNSDASVQRSKGPTRPVNPIEARATVLAGLEAVDYLTVFHERTPLELIRAVRPDVLVKGADYRRDQVVGRAYLVESYGGRVHLAVLREGILDERAVAAAGGGVSPLTPGPPSHEGERGSLRDAGLPTLTPLVGEASG